MCIRDRIGTTAETIFKAEDRQAFKDTMEKIGEPCAPSQVVHKMCIRDSLYRGGNLDA